MVKLFINDKILDLFGDEEIKIVSKSSDIESLDKVFSDFSMPFSVPATPNNNEIFSHYYNSHIENGLDPNKRLNAYIEYHSFPFKFGKIQLEGVKLKDNIPYSYNLTFYGGATQLKETFGEHTIDKLDQDLEGNKVYDVYSALDYEYTEQEWKTSLWNDTFKDAELITPLIAVVDRPLQLGSGNSNDVLGNRGALRASETRPAIRLARVMKGIENKFDVSFSDQIFNSAHFNNLYLWLNNREELEYPVSIIPFGNFTGPDPDNRFSFVDGYFNYRRNYYSDDRDLNTTSRPVDYRLIINYGVTPTLINQGVRYKVRVTTSEGRVILESDDWEYGNSTYTHTWQSRNPSSGDDRDLQIEDSWKVEIISSSGMVVDVYATIRYDESFYDFDLSRYSWQPVYGDYIYGNIINYELIQTIEIEPNVPQIKVIDLIGNLMKMYKAIIVPTSQNSFDVMNIDEYYLSGDEFDITKYVKIDNSDINVPEIYNKIIFKYKKTKNFFGTEFRQRVDPLNDEIGYGDLGAEFDVDSKKDLRVELIFNNMIFNRMVYNSKMVDPRAGEPSNIIIGQSTSLDGSDFKKNKSDPIIFYRNGVSFFGFGEEIKVGFRDIDPESLESSPVVSLTDSHIIGNSNNWKVNQITDTINWGAENDMYHNGEIDRSLYSNYWSNWIESIYSPKQRKIKLKANLPLSILSKIKLNSTLIINDNSYNINEMGVNLSTGETDLTLFKKLYPTSKPPIIDRFNIDANPSSQYYGVKVNVDKAVNWTASLMDDGDGTDWIQLYRSTGTGTGEVLFRIKSVLELPNIQFLYDRKMILRILVEGIYYEVPIYQRGFRN